MSNFFAEKQAPTAGTLFRGSYICKDLPFAKNICKDMAYCHIIVPDFFIRQSKIILDRKPFPMRCGPAPPFSRPLRRQAINDGTRPCISYKVKVLIFVHNGNKVLFYIPAVIKDDNIFLISEFWHHLADYGCSQSQLGFLFLPYTLDSRKRDEVKLSTA